MSPSIESPDAALVTDAARLPSAAGKGPFAVIAPRALESRARTGPFLDISTFDAGEDLGAARAILASASSAVDASGRPVLERFEWKGLNVWPFHYMDAFLKYCLPLSRYQALVDHCNAHYRIVHVSGSPDLIQAFQAGYNGDLRVAGAGKGRRRELLREAHFVINNLLQLAISLACLPVLILRRRKMGLLSLDFISDQGPWDFRFHGIYAELVRRKQPFDEFIWSAQPIHVMLKHFLRRRKAVFYTSAVVNLARWLHGRLPGGFWTAAEERDPSLRILRLICPKGLGHLAWSIPVLAWVFRATGLKVFFAYSLIDRTLAELAACRQAGVKTVGIVHGMPMRAYTLWEFYEDLPPGGKLSYFDAYGVWSRAGYEHLVRRSRLLGTENLEVSGYLRRFLLKEAAVQAAGSGKGAEPPSPGRPLKVLWISEPLLDPEEAWPFLRRLMAEPGMEVALKIRPMYEDRFQKGLLARYPESSGLKVETGNIFKALGEYDVAVGSHSTGVLDALVVGKPFVLFRTRKWGDCFDLGEAYGASGLYAQDPEDLLRKVKESRGLPREDIDRLKTGFFGGDDQDGSLWVVEKMHALLEKSRP